MSGKSTSVIDSTRCFYTEMLCSGHNDVERISEEVLNILDRQSEIHLDSIIHRPSAKTHLTVNFYVYLMVGSAIKVSRGIRHRQAYEV
jgi:hypothetical protein